MKVNKYHLDLIKCTIFLTNEYDARTTSKESTREVCNSCNRISIKNIIERFT